MPQSPLHDQLLANQHAPREEHKVDLHDHNLVNNNVVSPSAQDLVDVSGAQVVAAAEHGQEIVVKYEDKPWLSFAIANSYMFNYAAAQLLKQLIEVKSGDFEKTSFGSYGNSAYDAGMAATLMTLELFLFSGYLKANKLVIDQGLVAIGSTAMGLILEALPVNAKLLNEMARPYASLIRAGVSTFFGWGLKHGGNKIIDLCTAKKTVVTSQVEEQAEEAPVLSGRRFTTG